MKNNRHIRILLSEHLFNRQPEPSSTIIERYSTVPACPMFALLQIPIYLYT
jgi:hypothetical protein